MKRYRATLTAEFEVTAENIVEARRATKRVRALGEVVGSRRELKTRDPLRYEVRRLSETLRVTPATPNPEETKS